MKTIVNEIETGIYRLSTYVPQAGPVGFTFNQFFIDAEEPLLFHTGGRMLFRSFPRQSAAFDRLKICAGSALATSKPTNVAP